MRLRDIALALGLAAAGCHGGKPVPAPLSGGPPPSSTPPDPTDWAAVLTELDYGCLAYSDAGDALCITTRSSIQAGEDVAFTWLGPDGPDAWPAVKTEGQSFADPVLPADVRDRAVSRLRGGNYHRLPEARWTLELEEGDEAQAIEAPEVVVRWTRTAVEHVDVGDGAWERYRDVVRLEKPRPCVLSDDTIENPTHSSLAVWPLPGGALLVERGTGFAIEGDSGGTIEAYRVGLSGCP